MKTEYDFFSKMLLDFFVSIDDSYDYIRYVDGCNNKVNELLKEFGICDTVVADTDDFVVIKYIKYENEVYLKFVKSENSKEGLLFRATDIEITIPKLKSVVYFE